MPDVGNIFGDMFGGADGLFDNDGGKAMDTERNRLITELMIEANNMRRAAMESAQKAADQNRSNMTAIQDARAEAFAKVIRLLKSKRK